MVEVKELRAFYHWRHALILSARHPVVFECDLREGKHELTVWTNGVKQGDQDKPYTLKLPEDRATQWHPAVGVASFM